MKYISGILLIVFLISCLINTASAVSSTSTFDEDNRTLIINKPASNIAIHATNNTPSANDLLMTVQQVSVKPDLVTMEEIFKITSYETYTFTQNKDFNILWQKFKGQNDIRNAKWEILETARYDVSVPDFDLIEKTQEILNIQTYSDVTDIYDVNPWRLDWGVDAKMKWDIISTNGKATIGFDHYEITSTTPLNIKFFWYENEQTGSHQEIRYRDEWKPFVPEGRTIQKDENYFIKLTFYKQAETGSFSIRTIPRFAGIDEDRLTWWNASWNYRIDNQISNGVRPYQLSLTMSNSMGLNNATHVFLNGNSNINFSDIRFTLDNTTSLSYWIEKETGKVWVNVTANGIINLYYGNPSAADASDGKKTFEFFDDFEPESWKKIQKLPKPHADQAGAVLNGKIYTIGGYNTSYTVPVALVWTYDPVTNSYLQRASLTHARWGLACTGYSSNIFCFGGSPNYITEKYYPENNTWVTLSNPPLPLQNQGLSAVSDETYIYLFRNGSLYQYDPIDDSYILLSSTPPQNVVNWPSMAIYRNEIYIISGYYNGAGRNYVQIYNITNNLWRTGASMPIGLYGTLRENPVINDKIYVLQGQGIFNRADFFSRYWVYNISNNSWNWGELGYWDADGVSGGVIGNKIYTFGGRRGQGVEDYGTDFAGVLDTTKNTPGNWIDVRSGSWRVDSSSLMNGLRQYYPTVQIRTAEQVVNSNNKVISRLKYSSGSSGFGGLITHSNGGVYGSNNNGYFDPYINITANRDELRKQTGSSSNLLLDFRSLASPDVWHTYISNYGSSSIRSTRNGKDEITAPDGTYRGGYIQVIKTSDFKLLVDYVAVARYVTSEPAWSSWSKESSNTNIPNIISWSNNKTNDNSLALTINTSELVKFDAAPDQTITTWNWLKDEVNQNNNFDNITVSWFSGGTKTIKVYAVNSNGTSNIITWTVTVKAPSGTPSITGSTPESPVNDIVGATRAFNITVNKTVDVTWYINGTPVQFNGSTTTAIYTNTSAISGTWVVNATATNANGTVSREWTWIVSSTTADPYISFIYPTPADGATIAQDFAFIDTTVSGSSTAFIDWNHSLAGWWRFNGESGENPVFFRDGSSWGNNGSCSGIACPLTTSGKFGSALRFDGSNDYIDAKNKASLNIVDAITVEAWVYANGSQDYWDTIASKLAWGTPRPGYSLQFVGSNTLSFYSKNTFASSPITLNTWIHAAGIYNRKDTGKELKIYINGELKDSKSLAGGMGISSSSVRIGALPYANTGYFKGNIDEVRIHSRALRPEEIKASYNAGIHRLSNNFTRLADGFYNYRAYAQDLSGTVGQTETRTVTATSIVPGTPTITNFAPSSPVYNFVGDSRTFNFTANQMVNVSWYINGTEVKGSEKGVTSAIYSNTSAVPGIWIVNVTATNTNGTASREWMWIVSSPTADPPISFIYPTPADGATISQDYAYINTTVSGSSTAFIDWNRSLASWWRFNGESDENPAFFRDRSSWGNNGSCSGTACPLTTNGKFGSALRFDGTNDYVNIGNKASLNIVDAITVEAWVYANGSQDYWDTIASKLAWGTPRPGYSLQFVGSNILSFYSKNTFASSPITLNTWIHAAGIYDRKDTGKELKIYINGELKDSKSLTGGMGVSSSSVRIGALPYANTGYFKGNIDEVRIHRRALSPEEIKASYNAGIYRLYNNFTRQANGAYDYGAYAQDLSGNVGQTGTRSLDVSVPP